MPSHPMPGEAHSLGPADPMMHAQPVAAPPFDSFPCELLHHEHSYAMQLMQPLQSMQPMQPTQPMQPNYPNAQPNGVGFQHDPRGGHHNNTTPAVPAVDLQRDAGSGPNTSNILRSSPHQPPRASCIYHFTKRACLNTRSFCPSGLQMRPSSQHGHRVAPSPAATGFRISWALTTERLVCCMLLSTVRR